MTQGAAQTLQVLGAWAHLFISWKGTLIITTMLLTPLLFFFFKFYLYFTFAVTLGFLQGNKSVAQCNKRKLFFLSLLPEHSETFYEHLFLSAMVAKKKKKSKGGRKETAEIPHANARASLVPRTNR